MTASLILSFALLFSSSGVQVAPVPSVAGTWNMQVQGDHVVPVALVLTQAGSTVAGTVMLPSGDVPVKGEFTGGTLTLKGGTGTPPPVAASGGHAAPGGALVITARLTPDGTLEGEFSGGRGAMKWTAERLRQRPGGNPTVLPTIAGAWNMGISMQGNTMALVLTIAVEGPTVTGTLSSDHSGVLAVHGTYKDGALSFETNSQVGSQTVKMTYVGHLKADGSLAGTMVAPTGELPWTATRTKK